MTLNQILTELYGIMDHSPFDTDLCIMRDSTVLFGTSHDDHIRRLIIKQPQVKRWAVYNDESKIMIELEGARHGS